MTRARTASFGVAILTAIQPLLGAVLMLCVSLVQGAATTFRMILHRRDRDWHTEDAHEDLPQATSGTQLQEPNSTHGVMLGLVPRISAGPARGLSIDPLETINQDARVKPEQDSVGVATSRMEACLLARVPGEGRDPVLRKAQTAASRATSALTRVDQTTALILSLSKDAGDTDQRLARQIA